MTKVLIGIPTSGFSRNDRFYDYYNMLEKPAGTPCMFARGQSPARNRNIMIQQALDIGCTHIFFIDDDMALPPDSLVRLLKHDVDIVTGYYLMRNFPHKPNIFDEAFPDGRCVHHFPDANENGLIEIVNCGLGCCLIKIDVFKALEKPWIRLGETEIDHWGDDIGFFNRVRNLTNFKLYCDLSLEVGHMAQAIVKPKYKDGKWYVAYDSSGDGGVEFPAITMSKEQREKLLAGV